MDGFEELAAGSVTTRLYARGPRGDNGRGVVVFHPWWGLNTDVVAYVDRLAAAGFTAVAPDLYRGPVVDTIEEADRLSSEIDEDAADAIALAATDELQRRLGERAPIATLGFSMGVAWSIWAAAERPSIGGTVVYYGTVSGPSLARASAPVLGHFAETDPYEPDDSVVAFEQALREAGRSVTIHRYPGTGHWFAEPSRDAYRSQAAELAFERTVAFLREELGEGR